ncbi:hypothetical protein M2137_000703 [Parabacteroides sp. PFB2-10]|uniref:hypothetical protein n=1 Tax=Parabacteroides sp. PFB2-10 TaxID=1742405 RepID=UPI002475D76D|nr:hypothetical protein [Parabacteroides sp. PFB2-10]MDH6311940.1 hypothetical protein [Parabacteroides sp. PFB2-10]MDL2244157.1 hypothetical protein [Parabacteroides sp. OttesenSCG-928-J18]
MEKVTGLIKENKLMLIGLIVGAIGGFLYWRLIGCSGGSCPITSSPLMSTLWGAIMGGLLIGSFKKKKEE